jgi:hypothetical protein
MTPPMRARMAESTMLSFLPRQSTTKPEIKDAVEPPTYEILVFSALVAVDVERQQWIRLALFSL